MARTHVVGYPRIGVRCELKFALEAYWKDPTAQTRREEVARMLRLQGLAAFEYPNEFGHGIYDTHSPRIPSVEEIMTRLEQVMKVIRPKRMWVNPDCEHG